MFENEVAHTKDDECGLVRNPLVFFTVEYSINTAGTTAVTSKAGRHALFFRGRGWERRGWEIKFSFESIISIAISNSNKSKGAFNWPH